MAQGIAFDTLAYAKKLKVAGFTEEQAEVQVETLAGVVNENLATKHDIQMLKNDLKETEVALRRDMKEMELRLTIRLGAMIAAGIAIVAALVKLL